MTIDYSLDEYIKSSLIYSHWYYLSKSNWTFIHDHHSLFMLLPDNFILFILTTFSDALSWWHFLYCCCCCMDGYWCCIFGLEFASMVRALPLRWCKSTLPRFSESIVFETCVPLTFDGIYNSKFTQYLLIHYCPHLTYLGFSLHRICLVQSTEKKNHISFAMIAISRCCFFILFCILMRFGTFRKYLTITNRKQDWWYTTH